MSISIQYEIICNGLQQFVIDNPELFTSFDQVFLFGSVLTKKAAPNDIDMLLVYSADIESIISSLPVIRERISAKFRYHADLTVLSSKELENTKFLEKIKQYKRIK